MIASAMKTCPDEPLAFRDLARRRAEISRQLGPAALPRWAEAVAREAVENSALESPEPDWAVQADLRFSLDDEGLVWVHGEYSARAGLTCKRCLELLGTDFSGALALCLVPEDSRATELAQTRDVLVVSGDKVAIADILEDELLLGIPEQLCEEEPCERRPTMRFPSGDEPAAEPDGPFVVLGELKFD